MFDKTLVQLHEQLVPFTRLAYHIAYKAGCTGSNKITVENDNVQLMIAYDPLECSIRVSFNGYESFEIVVNRPECENTSYSFVNLSHNFTLGRFRFRSNNWDDNPKCTYTSEKNENNFHDINLFSTEEELFQRSTVQSNVPSIELLESFQEIFKVYNFIDKEIQFAVKFSDRPELHNDNIMKPLADEAWSLLPALVRKIYAVE